MTTVEVAEGVRVKEPEFGIGPQYEYDTYFETPTVKQTEPLAKALCRYFMLNPDQPRLQADPNSCSWLLPRENQNV